MLLLLKFYFLLKDKKFQKFSKISTKKSFFIQNDNVENYRISMKNYRRKNFSQKNTKTKSKHQVILRSKIYFFKGNDAFATNFDLKMS